MDEDLNQQNDSGMDSAVMIECEIEILMRRLGETDPDAVLRLERLFAKFKKERVVEIMMH